MKDTSNADLTIKATGYQWKWGYDYLKGEGEGIAFLSTLDVAQRHMSDAGKPEGDDYLLKVDNPLVVPVDRKIRIITTANDVIHAWMVPAFASSRTPSPASCATPGSAPRRWATFTASAPSCAARSTPTCPST
jgi:cytochrome c oxidase subunit 2